MMDLEHFKKDIWYGEVSNHTIETLKSNLRDSATEKESFILINELLKLGDFSVKGLLIELMNSTRDELVLHLCTRLFCSVATHDDLLETNNLKFLSSASEDGVHNFVVSAGETLSYHVVPYLLALLEEWEDTFVEKAIRNELSWMLGIEDEYYEVSLEEFNEAYSGFIENNDTQEYYYHNRLSFPGDLAKKLVPEVMSSLRDRTTYNVVTIPSVLSIWSGSKCPIQYDTIITNEKNRELMSYIDVLTKKEWKIGKKYFYGHVVV
ncbi:hypothetical protein COE49_07730 [Bacillus sp. AFS029637]|nr:hypothetical protein COE49_07730 [Bacillus sp. AFS029637]